MTQERRGRRELIECSLCSYKFQQVLRNVIYLSPGAQNEFITVIGQKVHTSSFTKVSKVTELLLLSDTTVSLKYPYIFFLTGIRKAIHSGKIRSIEIHSNGILCNYGVKLCGF